MATKTSDVQLAANPESGAPDIKTLSSVREILRHLSKTVSAHKLFPDLHESLIQFREGLLGLFQAYFEDRDELELDIEANAFRYEGEVVLKDDNILRSLPHLFFKDGMKTLTFLKGLVSTELDDFLSLIKTTSLLPLEVSDIVDALWQKEFEHIRFYAPDDYLEAQVGAAERIPIQFQVYKGDLYRGRIELKPDDVAAMFGALRDPEGAGPKPAAVDAGEAILFTGFDESEQRRLESLLIAERRMSDEQESIDLTFELLLAEDRPEVVEILLNILEQTHAAALQTLDFFKVVQLIGKADQLAERLEGAAPEKVRAVEQFRRVLRERSPRNEIRRAAAAGRIPSPKHLLDYLTLMGPPALPLAAELYESSRDTEFRALARDYFEQAGRDNPQGLAEQAGEDHPFITKAIIDVFGRTRDPRAVSSLIAFMAYREKSVRLRSIQTLGSFDDATAQKALWASLRDENEEVRIEAAAQIKLGTDPGAVREWIGIVSEAAFLKKSSAEKAAFLQALGRSPGEEAGAFLRGLVEKSSFFGRAKLREVRLGAVRALEARGGTEAAETLEAAARKGDRKVREACREALARLRSGRMDSGKRRI